MHNKAPGHNWESNCHTLPHIIKSANRLVDLCLPRIPIPRQRKIQKATGFPLFPHPPQFLRKLTKYSRKTIQVADVSYSGTSHSSHLWLCLLRGPSTLVSSFVRDITVRHLWRTLFSGRVANIFCLISIGPMRFLNSIRTVIELALVAVRELRI